MELKKLPKIALGAWAWGNDGTFGGSLSADDLRPVFEAGMKAGLNLWDTAYAYGMGASERVLGDFIKGYPRVDVILSDKFTPQCADPSAENAVTELSLLNRSSENSGILDYCKEKDITFFLLHGIGTGSAVRQVRYRTSLPGRFRSGRSV